MNLNNLIEIQVYRFLKCRKKLVKYSLVMTNDSDAMYSGWMHFYLLGLRIHALVHLLTYLHSSGRIKLTISETVEDRAKATINGLIKSYTGFRLPPKCMTLNDLCVRFRVIDSLNAAKMTKCSLVMTPTPCRMAGRVTSIRPMYSRARALIGWLCAHKTVDISETVEYRAKVTINGLYKIVHGLSIAAKMYDLE